MMVTVCSASKELEGNYSIVFDEGNTTQGSGVYFKFTTSSALVPSSGIIRASVDALCRDGADEISRDPRRKRLNPRRESLAKPSKLPSNYCLAHL